ncbi:MAG: signal peptidase II [Gammaproteobacteria bacterium]|jgi:signal peptidase II|nr:signal peptidase II [Gammaproteobacteria bacterium]
MPGLYARWLLLSVLVVVLDQYSKWLVLQHFDLYETLHLTNWFNLTLAYNTGAAFSFLNDAGGWQRWLFVALAVVITGVLLVWLQRARHLRLQALALALIIGGAIGNVIDRVRLGHVIDFIDWHYHDWHWPVFNLADSAISVGVVLLIVDSLFSLSQDGNKTD